VIGQKLNLSKDIAQAALLNALAPRKLGGGDVQSIVFSAINTSEIDFDEETVIQAIRHI
jgi:hypothetical protein